MPHASSSHVLLMPNSFHLTHGISNLVSLITKTKLGLSQIYEWVETKGQAHPTPTTHQATVSLCISSVALGFFV
jgi:hypothetical protein